MNLREQIKFKNGELAREKWRKEINDDLIYSIDEYNKECGDKFKKIADIILDGSAKKQSTLDAKIYDKKLWNTKKEFIYIITKNNNIIKIGGTRDGMKGRWSSYCCGYYVPERKSKSGKNYPGKMSVTNAYIYHTIENDLLYNDAKWEFYVWDLPIIECKINIFGIDEKVIVQSYHAYESCCIKKYKKLTGRIPILCSNSDPSYI